MLLDEAAPELVLLNRKLFQAPNSMVQLAQSKTGCHSYEVYLNDALLVISSNHWVEALAKLRHSESAWLEANQVLIKVTRPLWVPRQQGHHQEPIAMMIVFCSSEGATSMRAPGRGPCHGRWCLQWLRVLVSWFFAAAASWQQLWVQSLLST